MCIVDIVLYIVLYCHYYMTAMLVDDAPNISTHCCTCVWCSDDKVIWFDYFDLKTPFCLCYVLVIEKQYLFQIQSDWIISDNAVFDHR